jgi:hypothetical protein
VWLKREVSGADGEGRRGLLERHDTARQVLQKLAGKITFTPTRGRMGAPAYDITAPLTFERVFSGILVHMGNVPSGNFPCSAFRLEVDGIADLKVA